MTSIRVIVSRMTTKKVPALALVVVGLVGMVAGVLAASMTITTSTYTAEMGSFHNVTGAFNVTDNGLAVASVDEANTAQSAQALGAGSLSLYANVTAGQWLDSFTFGPPATSGTHVAHITFRQGTSTATGAYYLSITTGTWTTSASSTGYVTVYVGLKTDTISTPLTAYVTVS